MFWISVRNFEFVSADLAVAANVTLIIDFNSIFRLTQISQKEQWEQVSPKNGFECWFLNKFT